MKLFIPLLILSIGMGCGPMVRKSIDGESEISMGPSRHDTDLSRELRFQAPKTAHWNSSLDSADFVDYLGQLRELEKMSRKSSQVRDQRLSLVRDYVSRNSHEGQLVVNGEYVKLLIQLKEVSTVKTIRDMRSSIQGDLDSIIEKVNSWNLGELSENDSMAPFVEKLIKNVDQLIVWMNEKPVHSSLLALTDGIGSWRTKAPLLARKFDREVNLSELIRQINGLTSEFGDIISADVRKEMNQAAQLGALIDRMRTDKQALEALVFVWRMLPRSERLSTFNRINSDLADVLKSSNEKELDCLAGKRDCGFVMGIKKYFVLRGLRDKGISQVRAEMDSQGVQRAKAKLKDTINEKIKSLRASLPVLAQEKFNSSSKFLDQLISDFSGTLRSRIATLSLKEGKLVPMSYIVESKESTQAVELRAQGREQESVISNALLAGILPFIAENPSISSSQKDSFLLGLLSSNSLEYLSSQEASDVEQSPDLSAGELARAIQHHAELLRELRNGTNLKELSVFSITAQDVITEAQSDLLATMNLFPVEATSALILSRASKLVSSLQKKGGLLRLVDVEGSVVPENSGVSPVAAALTDRVQGKAQRLVKSADVARMIIAVSTLIRAIDQIEPVVKEFTTESEIAEGRESAKKLLFGLTNYLSKYLRRADGLVANSMRISEGINESSPVLLSDQLLAIRAFKAADLGLGTKIFRWQAVDTYFMMNAHFYVESIGFYSAELGSAELPPMDQILLGVTTLQQIREHLPSKSQNQLDMIVSSWIEFLDNQSHRLN